MAYGAMDGTPSQPNSTPTPREPDAFHATALPASQPAENTEQQTQSREKLQLQWGDLLQAAVRDPGLLLDAYSRFHGYSLGNRLAALWQCHSRGLEPGPIHTYQGVASRNGKNRPLMVHPASSWC